MKRVKIILWCCVVFIISCTEMDDVQPIQPSVKNIFNVDESIVINGQSIYFDLPSEGTYTLTMEDKETGQIISREKFIGKIGENIKNIYTNSIQSQYLYLSIEDVSKNELKKTIIILKK